MNKKLLLFFITIAHFSLLKAQYKDYYKEGNEYMNQRKYALAEQTFRDGVIADSSLHILYTSCAHALLMQKKYSEADSALDEVLKKNGAFFGAHWYKGLNYLYWQKDSLAIISFKEYLKYASPQNNEYNKAYYYLGRAYEILLTSTGLTDGEISEMFAYYQKYCVLAEGHPTTTRILGFIEKVKLAKPANFKGKWVYKEEKLKESEDN